MLPVDKSRVEKVSNIKGVVHHVLRNRWIVLKPVQNDLPEPTTNLGLSVNLGINVYMMLPVHAPAA